MWCVLVLFLCLHFDSGDRMGVGVGGEGVRVRNRFREGKQEPTNTPTYQKQNDVSCLYLCVRECV